MQKPKAVGLGAKMNDEETRAIIYEGASQSHLAMMFDIDKRDVARRLYKLAPCGERQGYPIYKVKDAAPFLVPPDKADVEDAIRRMSPKDLPPALTKEYWAAQHARLKFEEDQGDLWRTGQIVETLAEVFKTARMTLLLMRDQVERQTELTNKQRDIIQGLIDGTLNQLADNLIERFKNGKQRRTDDGSGWEDPEEDEDEAL